MRNSLQRSTDPLEAGEAGAAGAGRPASPPRRRCLFRLLCVLLALAPFVAAEMYLRLGGSVDTVDLSEDPIFSGGGDAALFGLNPETNRWEIPPSRSNFFRPASFAAEKSKTARRVFVLGGSTVQGRPYETETAFAKWLELRLHAADRSHDYEIINCGGVSYASYRVARVLDEVLQHAPDAIVLYTGHNEFLEERSYPQAFGRQRGWADSLADSLHLVRSLRRWKAAVPEAKQPLPSQLTTRLDVVDGMKRYVRDDAWRAGVAQHFGITLRRMIGACRRAAVPVIVCMPTSEIVRTPPMKIERLPLDQKTASRFDAMWSVACDGHASVEERLRACDFCLQLDPGHAGAHFIAGRLNWDRGDADQAGRHLVAARDHDVCPLRATTPILEQLLDTCNELGLVAVRCDHAFDRTNAAGLPIADGIADPENFVDHVHPSIEGHQLIARQIAERLCNVFAVTPRPSAEPAYQRLATEHWQTLDESYFSRAKLRLAGLKNWAAGRAGRLALPESDVGE